MKTQRLPILRPGAKLGNLTFMCQTDRIIAGYTSIDPGVELQCACGISVVWSRSEFNRRRRRWVAQGRTPQCATCEANTHRDTTLYVRKSRVAEPSTERFLRSVWTRMVRERVARDRAFRDSTKLQGLVGNYTDAFVYCIDRRWTSADPDNGDPFENFSIDMGPPPPGKTNLLRKDVFAPFTRLNCYWGDATQRRVNRYSNADVLLNLGVPTVSIDGIGEAPYSIVQGSRFDPYTHDGNGRAVRIVNSAPLRNLRGSRYTPTQPVDWFDLNNAADACGINVDRGLAPDRKPAPTPAKYGVPLHPDDQQPGETEEQWAARLGLED